MKKTKNTLKIKLYLLAVFAVMLTALSLSSFKDNDTAESMGEYIDTDTAASEGIGDGSTSFKNGEEGPTLDGITEGENDGANGEDIKAEDDSCANTRDDSIGEKTEKAENDESFFGTVYAEFLENSDKILSALSFIASLVLMFFYKNGLIPSVESTVKTLASNVRSVNKATEGLSLDNEKLKVELNERLDGAERALTLIGESLGKLEEKLSFECERENEQRAFRTVMAAEVDLLYEIFMAAELPHYLKENVGERISEMKAKLGEKK